METMEKIAEGISIVQATDRLSSNIYVIEHSNRNARAIVGQQVDSIEAGDGNDGNNAEIMLIDTGDGKTDFAKFLKKEPALVILTHNHFDHSQGVKEGWNVYLHEKDLEERKFAHVPKNAKRIDFESIRFHEFEFEIHNTPGHTPGSIVLLEKKTKILFSGDTLFAGGYPGRTDLEGGNERDMENSLKFIEKLDYGLLCPGHDEIEKRE